jgi:hypothetical protein
MRSRDSVVIALTAGAGVGALVLGVIGRAVMAAVVFLVYASILDSLLDRLEQSPGGRK